jgi:hypothetical protein
LGDDIGTWNVGAYTHGMMGRTPSIDSIAKDGILFTDHYGQPSCTAVSCRGLTTRRCGFGTYPGAATTCSRSPAIYTPTMSSEEEMKRLFKRYGVKIDEPICRPGIKIPFPTGAGSSLGTWSREALARPKRFELLFLGFAI